MQRIFVLFLIAIVIGIHHLATAQTEYSDDDSPTGLEEEIRWRVNRARFDRASENQSRRTAYADVPASSAPLAPNQFLTLAARHQSEDMATHDLFEHGTVTNSAYYNLSGRPCLSLSEALVRQGRRSAHSVVLQQTLAGMVCRPGGIWTDMASKVWAHMVRTSPIARNIARGFDVDPEQAMTLGLLHDVGKLVIFDRVSALRTANRGDLDLRKGAVSRLLRVLHEPLGGICALHWNLGDDSALAIATHHRDPLPAVPGALSEVLWLAERWELAAWRLAPVKLGDLWAEGRLTGRVPDVVDALKSPGGAAEPSLSR
jgi:hypothetical protein